MRLSKHRGFTLVEVLIAVAILAIVIPVLVMGFTTAYVGIRGTRMLELARVLTQMVMEQKLYEDDPADETDVSFGGMPGFAYDVDVDDSSGRTVVTVTVKYSFSGQRREYRAVSVHE